MEKIWYIKLDHQIEGPFSVKDLKFDKRLTPDTLVFKKGFKKWLPIREVPELKEVFFDEENLSAVPSEESKKNLLVLQDEIALNLQNNYSPFLFLLILLLLIFYVFYNFHMAQ